MKGTKKLRAALMFVQINTKGLCFFPVEQTAEKLDMAWLKSSKITTVDEVVVFVGWKIN